MQYFLLGIVTKVKFIVYVFKKKVAQAFQISFHMFLLIYSLCSNGEATDSDRFFVPFLHDEGWVKPALCLEIASGTGPYAVNEPRRPDNGGSAPFGECDGRPQHGQPGAARG